MRRNTIALTPGSAPYASGMMLIALISVNADAQASDPCVVPKSETARPGIFDQIHVEVVEGYSEQEVQEAIDLWDVQCANEDGSKSPKMVTQDPEGDNWTIQLRYVNLNAAGDGHCGTRVGNELTVYAFTKVGDGTISCGDKAQTTAHEMGHWLGLADVPQPQSEACEDYIMAWLNQRNGSSRSVQPGECEAVDRTWSTPLECEGPNPPTDGCPTDPIAKLPNLCDLLGLLCPSSRVPGGSPEPWWTIPETRPDLICSLNEVPGPEETIQIVEECEYVPKSTILPRAGGTRPGPVTAVRTPAEGALVRGVVSLDGWMREEASGVTGTLGFWIDRQSVYPAAVTYGDADSAGCSGSADPNCPYIGFSGSLDTTVLADGPHTLEVVGAQNAAEYPIPGYGKSTFTVDNTRPTVSITSPSQGATLSGTVQVSVSASDASGIERVRFVVDGVHQAYKYAPPYTFSWNTLGWADGPHTVRTVAWDRAGNRRPWAVGVTLANDLQTPQVTLSQPVAGSHVRGSVTLEAQATDDLGVSRVEFYVNGALLATDTTAPYRVTWTTTGHADGSYDLTARAYDASGNVGTSPSVAVSVDNTAPTMYVDWPSYLQRVEGTSVQVSGWALDASGVVSRTFKLNGLPLPLNGAVQTVSRSDVCSAYPEIPDPACPDVGWRGYFDSTASSNGSHTLSVTVVDAAGNSTTANRTFIIDNPGITLTFHPVADATAWQVSPSYVDGTATTLGVRTTAGGEGAYAFLKFEVTGVQGQVTEARLRVTSASNMPDLTLYWLVHSSWNETNLSWNYFPGPGGTLGTVYNLVTGGSYSYDVRSFVGGDGTFSMGFSSSSPGYAFVRSRESSYKPVLEVTYDP